MIAQLANLQTFLAANESVKLVECRNIMRLLEDENILFSHLRHYNNKLVSLRSQLFEAASHSQVSLPIDCYSFKQNTLSRWGIECKQTEA